MFYGPFEPRHDLPSNPEGEKGVIVEVAYITRYGVSFSFPESMYLSLFWSRNCPLKETSDLYQSLMSYRRLDYLSVLHVETQHSISGLFPFVFLQESLVWVRPPSNHHMHIIKSCQIPGGEFFHK